MGLCIFCTPVNLEINPFAKVVFPTPSFPLIQNILQENIEELHIVAKGLLEYETLTGEEINDLIKGIKPERDNFDDDDISSPSTITPSVPKTGNTVHPQTN